MWGLCWSEHAIIIWVFDRVLLPFSNLMTFYTIFFCTKKKLSISFFSKVSGFQYYEYQKSPRCGQNSKCVDAMANKKHLCWSPILYFSAGVTLAEIENDDGYVKKLAFIYYCVTTFPIELFWYSLFLDFFSKNFRGQWTWFLGLKLFALEDAVILKQPSLFSVEDNKDNITNEAISRKNKEAERSFAKRHLAEKKNKQIEAISRKKTTKSAPFWKQVF